MTGDEPVVGETLCWGALSGREKGSVWSSGSGGSRHRGWDLSLHISGFLSGESGES